MSLLTLHSNNEYSRPTPRPGNRRVEIECGRLIFAAVINRRFRDLLLADPWKAIEAGYYGERFTFSHTEKDQITAIHAASLDEFASQLTRFSEAQKAPKVTVKVETT